MVDIEKLAAINRSYPEQDIHLLRGLNRRWQITKPLQGVSVLHNLILSYETLQKIEPLVRAGADVTVTNCDRMRVPFLEEVEDALLSCGIRYVRDYQDIKGSFDIGMDCAARIPAMKNVKIRRGIVELTQSGTMIYKKLELPFPVISVDDSLLKNFECGYGTGEAFMRAFGELSGDTLSHKKCLLFGYGKIGKGIVRFLSQVTDDIYVIDLDDHPVHNETHFFQSIKQSERSRINKAAENAFAIITATGVRDTLSSYFDPSSVAHAYLANMGVNGEIGKAFRHLPKLLWNGYAINFGLRNPTRMRYLDPIFYAHNLAGEQLAKSSIATSGYHPLDSALDRAIIKEWEDAYGEVVACF